jgi:ABC-type transport system involved in multi-copper enzyme maturation permease subunit
MQRLLAMVWLTWKAAFRFRLFWVLAVLLAGSVVLLPLLIQDDGTARGFTQILLTYTLSVIAGLLGMATLWLACGTLARDIEDGQMQMVAVKPIGRWQIWLGKWLGIVTLDAAMLALSGACVAGLLEWRAQRLPDPEQRRILRNEVLVSRASLTEPVPDFEEEVERELQARLKGAEGPVKVDEVRKDIREQFKALNQVVPPNSLRRWRIDLGLRRFTLKDQPLYVRVKFFAAQTNASGTYHGIWEIGPTNAASRWHAEQSLSANTFHEFEIPANLFDEQGLLTIDFQNRSLDLQNPNRVALLFPLDEGLEVLYREGGFALNFARGLSVILCWLALLASLGLAAASLVSFPVATFVSASVMVVAFSSGTLANAVEAGTVAGVNEETGQAGSTKLDLVLIPLFKMVLRVLNLAQGYSPIDALSTGRAIPWLQLVIVFAQVVLLLGGVLAVVGIVLFTRRELAAEQGNS